MIKQLKSFTINIVAGANAASRSWAWLSLCS